MTLELHNPLDGYYLGTRFDRGGVFKSLVYKGVELCGEWFEHYSPTMHDAVCGPAEEFSLAPCGGFWLKPGVGLLRPDNEPYDRFRLYEIVSPGRWEVSRQGGDTVFRHILEPYYDYTKEIRIVSDSAFEIRHALEAHIPWDGWVYNHNFFTMDKMSVGPGRRIDFPFAPDGSWRSEYSSVGLTGSGIRFSRVLEKGESVFNGSLHEACRQGMPYDMTLSEGPLSVHIKGDVPLMHTVFWANHRVACLEPYNALKASAGQIIRWAVRYELNLSEDEIGQ